MAKGAFYLVVIMLVIGACQASREPAGNDEELAIIPKPAKVKLNMGTFAVKKNTIIYCESNDLIPVAKYLDAELSGASGFSMPIKEGSGKGINLLVTDTAENALGKEGYRLNVKSRSIEIIANKSNGIFYGIQTLLQMLPPQAKNGSLQDGAEWKIRCAEIEDIPRFSWRGILFDVSKHFFTVDEIKRLIDEMVKYKFNILHLHLTDDQGWRIEIKKLPELTATGASVRTVHFLLLLDTAMDQWVTFPPNMLIVKEVMNPMLPVSIL